MKARIAFIIATIIYNLGWYLSGNFPTGQGMLALGYFMGYSIVPFIAGGIYLCYSVIEGDY